MVRTTSMNFDRSGRDAACFSSVKGAWRILLTKLCVRASSAFCRSHPLGSVEYSME
jgi:hypothetical protein